MTTAVSAKTCYRVAMSEAANILLLQVRKRGAVWWTGMVMVGRAARRIPGPHYATEEQARAAADRYLARMRKSEGTAG